MTRSTVNIKKLQKVKIYGALHYGTSYNHILVLGPKHPHLLWPYQGYLHDEEQSFAFSSFVATDCLLLSTLEQSNKKRCV